MSEWTFFSNHAHVLFVLARDPTLRLREVAQQVQITERAVQRIVAELAESGFITVEREGRRNQYRIEPDRPLRHPVEAHRTIRDLLEVLARDASAR